MVSKTKYICASCGYESAKWYGKCPECSSWNSFEEVTVPDKVSIGKFKNQGIIPQLTPQKIAAVQKIHELRISTGFEEFDRVLGGAVDGRGPMGIVPGSVMLLSGDPGIGKSTLLLQLALNLAGGRLLIADSKKKRKDFSHLPSAIRNVLYITGEESVQQVAMRAGRIVGEKLSDSKMEILATTDIDAAIQVMEKNKPDIVIVDSVQTLATNQLPGFPGSVPQIRYVTSRVVSFAKSTQTPVFLVGHVTKEGIVAGPMVLSHMVDTVLHLEGEPLTGTRILRSHKNRFGDTSEVGIFVMEEKGLAQIQDVEGFFMNKRDVQVAGSCITVTMEGSRPLLVEVQALAVPTHMAFARRVSAGIQDKRLELLLAVIQKHLQIAIDKYDVFLNIVGGLKIAEPAIDLAVSLAIVSSIKNKPVKSHAAVGELGLLGELKNVPNLDKRIREAAKFGFSHIASSRKYPSLVEAAQNEV